MSEARSGPHTGAAGPIHIVHVEDDALDAELLKGVLASASFACEIHVVDTEAALCAALANPSLDLIISDYGIPAFSGLAALRLSRARRPDLPFIFVSGTIGEERAIEALKEGATDYVLKDRPARLVPAIRRALAEKAGEDARLRAEEALRRQAASLAQAEKLAAMGSLLAGVAHELSNPLAVIVGQTELLARGLAGPAAERVERISAAGARCARIVKNFLALARQRPPERQWVHLGRVVAEALELVAYPARAAGIEILTDLPDDLPMVWADPHQVHQVVVNLVTNAHHALREQPAARRIAVSLGRHEAEGVFLEVADTGPGIPGALLARVFEPFFTTKPAGEGTGLGLSLCRGIVESHGGVMRLHSQEGLGTLFRVELPRARGAADPPPAPAVAAPAAPGARVLVVDDEKDLALMVAELLTAEGHQVDVVTFAQQALERLGTSTYDVVLCDIRMPGMDGPALYASVQKRFPGLERRFAFLTGDTFSGGNAAFLEKSGARSLAKPFTLDEVVSVVNDVREGAALRPPPISPRAAGAAGA